MRTIALGQDGRAVSFEFGIFVVVQGRLLLLQRSGPFLRDLGVSHGFGGFDQLAQHCLSIADKADFHGEGPAGVARVDVYLDDVLTTGVEDVGAFSNGVLGAEFGADYQDYVGFAHGSGGGTLTVDADHANGQGVGFGDGTLALVACGDGHAPQFGELLDGIMGLGHVNAVADDHSGLAGPCQQVHDLFNILRSRLGRAGVEIATGVVDEGGRLHIHLADDRSAAHQGRRWAPDGRWWHV